jgi:hypothetical protein
VAFKIRNAVKAYFNIAVISLTICQAFARFIGPTLFTISIGQENTSSCNVNGNDYNTLGCGLTNFITTSVIYNSVSAFFLMIGYCYFTKNIRESETNSLMAPINV